MNSLRYSEYKMENHTNVVNLLRTREEWNRGYDKTIKMQID